MAVAIPEGYKRCSRGDNCKHPMGCIQPATLEYFSGNSKTTSGLNSWCRVCSRAYSREYNRRPESRERARQRAKLTPVDKELRNARMRERYQRMKQNPEFREKENERIRRLRYERYRNDPAFRDRERRNNRDHYANSPEVRERRKDYNQSLKGNAISKAVGQRRRARKRSLPDTFSAGDWLIALHYFHGCCAVCGRQLTDLFGERTAAADHWIPLSSPDCPGTIPANIVPLCHGVDGCNSSKSSRNPTEWLVWKFGKRKGAQILARIEAYFEWVKQREDKAS